MLTQAHSPRAVHMQQQQLSLLMELVAARKVENWGALTGAQQYSKSVNKNQVGVGM